MAYGKEMKGKDQIKELKRLVKNKNVLLVGNSVEVLSHELGELIDSYDTVVRFGKGFPRKKLNKIIGTRTDIAVFGILRRNYRKDYPDTKVILTNRCRMHMDCGIDPSKRFNKYKNINMWSDKELLNLFKEFGFGDLSKYGRRPSQGFCTFLFFLRKIPMWKSLTLIGFDFFAKTYPMEVGTGKPSSWHKPKLTIPRKARTCGPHMEQTKPDGTVFHPERDYALELEKKGIIKWIKLSDLTIEDIPESEIGKTIDRGKDVITFYNDGSGGYDIKH
jgi:hypothetical protein